MPRQRLTEKTTLTPRQMAFAREYCVDQQGTEAAIRAGYSKDRPSAQAYASRLLALPHVAAEIAKRQAKVAAKAEVTQERVIELLLADREYAREVRNAGAAVAATLGLAKVTGLLVEDRKNVKRPLSDFDTGQLIELENALASTAAGPTAH